MQYTVQNNGKQSRVVFNDRGRAVQIFPAESKSVSLKEGTATHLRRGQSRGDTLAISGETEDAEKFLQEVTARPQEPKLDKKSMLPRLPRKSAD